MEEFRTDSSMKDQSEDEFEEEIDHRI